MEDVRIPAAAHGRSGPRTAKNRKASAHAGRQKQLHCTLQNMQFYLSQGMRLKKVTE